MKKLVVILLMLAVAPVMAVEIGGIIDVNYFMATPADTDFVVPESYFGEVSAALWAVQELADGLTGKIKLAMVEGKSNGIDSSSTIALEELYVKKTGPFGQEPMAIMFGKMEVPFNLDYDTGITHCFTNGTALLSAGVGEIDNTWGLSGSYSVDGVGTFTLTTFEGMGGVADEEDGQSQAIEDQTDEDTGLFSSMAVQWDTGADKAAFNVEGLRMVVGLAMLASPQDNDNGMVISIGATYKGVKNLTLGLEIDITSNAAQFPASVINDIETFTGDVFAHGSADMEGGQLIAINADYAIEGGYSVGLSYEMFSYAECDIEMWDGSALYDITVDASTDTRMAIRGEMEVAEGSKVRLEYSTTSNSEIDEIGQTLIALGFFGKF
jgi:hypothetical protein